MLYEDDVVEAVSSYLRRRGYEVTQLTAMQRGHDIVARKQGPPVREIYMEAKGEGSSKALSARYGKAFSAAQVFDHVAKAVLKALRVASWDRKEAEILSGIALPRNAAHVREIEQVSRALRDNGIGVFWVDENRRVHVDSPWAV